MGLIPQIIDLQQPGAWKAVVVLVFSLLVFGAWAFYIFLYLVAPIPRAPLASEKKYRIVESDGNISPYEDLPCWKDRHDAEKKARKHPAETDHPLKPPPIAKADIFMSLVVPAFNEEERLGIMLTEAVDYLEQEYGQSKPPKGQANGGLKQRKGGEETSNGHVASSHATTKGWEILVVSDGSTDRTIDTALDFAKSLKGTAASNIRVIKLHENRGKGGAVIHGMRHIRGEYAIFADADGASKFEDLGKLVREAKKFEDAEGRSVAVGSRAHLVGSEAVVKRSFLRNLLMHSFHLLIRLLTPPATGAVKDTQCGFKLFSRASLSYIVPHMHSEGWIFDIEMLMLAESASIPVVEVPVGWKEVKGSKLNVVWDSLGMAWGLFVLRAAWLLGIYDTD
ncbi:uncharacterized protein KY384_000428 [Bacidia gigantensis]|uniref:uncharacterized protein n=1 Tax=Bacidia gigantensis TaxID=2732470 RepID=UPI001D045553|nr:uncharacterized protein KY384_000428 [Bacidia gigantensis]KAG8525668.1 hypothetical protein KY384_000428 [Bacidia gigantensis]